MAQSTTKRQTPADAEFVQRLTDQAKKRTPDPEKFRRAKAYSDAAEKNQRFEDHYNRSSIDGRPIHHFHHKGEYVIGCLGECQGETFGPSSFPFALDVKGQTGGDREEFDPPRAIRLPGNRRLAAAIRKADALYQRIKITYLGKLHAKTGGHYEKVYRIEPAPLSQEPMPAAGKSLLAKAAAEAASRKAVQP